MAGTTTDHHINHLRSLVSTDELILPSHTAYTDLTTTWAAQKNLRPKIIVRPFSASALSAVLAYLSQTDLDIAIHGSGYGSASARDVLVSMAAFDAFEFDRDAKVVTLGAGQTWREYYDKMERVGSGYHGMYYAGYAFDLLGSGSRELFHPKVPGKECMLVNIFSSAYSYCSGGCPYPCTQHRRQRSLRRLLLARTPVR